MHDRFPTIAIPYPRIFRVLSGGILGTLAAGLLVIVLSKIALLHSYATIREDAEGALYSPPVVVGLTVPAIYFGAMIILTFALPIAGILIQSFRRCPRVSSYPYLLWITPLVLLSTWWAYQSFINFLGQWMWMYHD